MAIQTKIGKSFEYACLISYYNYLKNSGMSVVIEENKATKTAEENFLSLTTTERTKMLIAAEVSVHSLIKSEPNLSNGDEMITLTILIDQKGAEGDVRDVVFMKNTTGWEIGISCKHNHQALKHSRLSQKIDFGQKWFNLPVSQTYFDEIKPVFERLSALRDETKHLDKKLQHKWDIISDKEKDIYFPVLEAFKKELTRLTEENKDVPVKLIEYLLGKEDFYKVIADEKEQKTIIQAFNVHNTLSQSYKNNKARTRIKDFHSILPTKIFDFDYKPNSKNTLILVMDNGWTISFRIHNASSRIEPSLKFDIQLIGIPKAVTNVEVDWD